ncbi:HP1 family phage holin [Brenneria uluponensis]|uniref:HP1 family phage holin n=1 Tax=Brenneria uluponensis TaxID=3057057 RepID=UPI0028E9922A|nr:HP1 family phage holin [Brenneria ulupoensis]
MGLNNDRIASAITYFMATLIATAGRLTLSDWATVIGIAIGLLTFLVNRNHKRRIEREQERRTDLIRELVNKVDHDNLPETLSALREMNRQDAKQ